MTAFAPVGMRKKIGRAIGILLPVTTALATAAIGLSKLDWPAGWWASRGWLVVAMIITSFTTSVVNGVVTEFGARRRAKKLELEDSIRAALAPTFILAVLECEADYQTVSVNVFKVIGWPAWKFRFCPKWLDRTRQVRLSRLRMSPVASSGLKWTKGKGVIGLCWAKRKPDWINLTESFAAIATTRPEKWSKLPVKKTFGLTYDEYQTLSGKYATIAVAPIIGDGDRYVGCVTLDSPTPLKNSRRGLQSLESTADIVGRLLRG